MANNSQPITNKINRINQLVKDGKLEEAIIRLEAIIETHPEDILQTELYSLLCKLYTRAGRESDIPALWLKKAKEIEPGFKIPQQKIKKKKQNRILTPKTDSHRKVAFICAAGLDSFIDDIINGLSKYYEVKKFLVRNDKDIKSAIDWADIVWLEWANHVAIIGTNYPGITGKKVIVRLHRYEAFTDFPTRINWNVVDKLILVAEHMKDILKIKVPDIESKVRIEVIHNGVNLEKFPFKERKPGFNIAWVAHINYRKDPAMMLQIIKKLVEINPRYKLHIAGDFQDLMYKLYLEYMIKEMQIEKNVIFYGWVNNINEWFKDKEYLLATTLHEGHPYNIMESMARGLKPVIHNYRGANESWPRELLFNSIDQAIEMIISDKYDGKKYRQLVEKRYPLSKQLNKIHHLIQDLPLPHGQQNNESIQAKTNLKEHIEDFYDNFLPHLARDHQMPNSRHQQFKSFMKRLNLKDKKVLDLGCGTGITSKFMAEQGASVKAVDLSPKLIKYAREKSLHPNIKYIVHDATTLQLNQIFDVITVVDLFEHIPRNEMNKFLNVLKIHSNDNTLIYLNIPDGRYQKFIKNHNPRLLQIIDESYYPDELLSLFASINMTPIFMQIYGLDIPVQYNQYLFTSFDNLSSMYHNSFKKFYNSKLIMSKYKSYLEKGQANYPESSYPGVILRRNALSPLLQTILHANWKVLDVGGSDGSTISHLQKKVAIHPIVLDLDQNRLQIAKRRGLQTCLANVIESPFNNAIIDAVLCLDIIEHLSDDIVALREIYRILRPDGVLILTTPILNQPFASISVSNLERLHESWGHVRPGYEPTALLAMLREVGFVVKNVQGCFNSTSQKAYQELFLQENLIPIKERLAIWNALTKESEASTRDGNFEIIIIAHKQKCKK